MNAKIYGLDGKEKGTATLPDELFAQQVHEHLLWLSVKRHLGNQRQGTAKVKTRGEVSGGGRKPWRQKGTGRARSGSNTSPLWPGGGRAFGPKPRDYSYALPKQALKAATRMAVLSKIRDNEAVVVDDFGLAAIKTKDMAGILKALNLRGVAGPAPAAAEGETPKKPKKKNLSLLIGTDKVDPVVYKSARNLTGVRVLPASDFTTVERVDRMVAPVITADDEFFRALFAGAPSSFDDLRAKAEKGEPLAPFTLTNVEVTVQVDTQYDLVSTQLSKNVVGVVEGVDPRLKSTYVFYGAHLDHEGYRYAPTGRGAASGPNPDLIYNGADDDGSGSTALLAMAKAFATEAAQRIVDDAVQVLGGAGVLASHPVDRLYRAVRALRIYEGTTEIQHLVIAGRLLGA